MSKDEGGNPEPAAGIFIISGQTDDPSKVKSAGPCDGPKSRGDMNITSLLIQLISGAAGGNAAGAMLKQFSLGPVGNSILGLIGGGVGGQLLHLLLAGGAGSAAAATGGMDLGSIISNVVGGGVGGGILMIIVGLIKSKMAQS